MPLFTFQHLPLLVQWHIMTHLPLPFKAATLSRVPPFDALLDCPSAWSHPAEKELFEAVRRLQPGIYLHLGAFEAEAYHVAVAEENVTFRLFYPSSTSLLEKGVTPSTFRLPASECTAFLKTFLDRFCFWEDTFSLYSHPSALSFYAHHLTGNVGWSYAGLPFYVNHATRDVGWSGEGVRRHGRCFLRNDRDLQYQYVIEENRAISVTLRDRDRTLRTYTLHPVELGFDAHESFVPFSLDFHLKNGEDARVLERNYSNASCRISAIESWSTLLWKSKGCLMSEH